MPEAVQGALDGDLSDFDWSFMEDWSYFGSKHSPQSHLVGWKTQDLDIRYDCNNRYGDVDMQQRVSACNGISNPVTCQDAVNTKGEFCIWNSNARCESSGKTCDAEQKKTDAENVAYLSLIHI